MEVNAKVINATKWSAVTEIAAKLIAPFSTIVLARLLTPEAFGVVTTLMMIITFVEIFTDAGYQRFIIQHEFTDEQEKYDTANVAFWSNFVMSLLIWGAICIFRDSIAMLVGNPGLGNVIAIACVSIPLAAFSSIQMALYKKDLNFKTLFYVRIISILIPIFVTIPLAYFLRSYWALVIGTIAINVSNAVILTYKSKWKPTFYYSFKRLREMFSFCSWTVLDTILVWATAYIDIFIVGIVLNEHFLGLYKASITTVGQITTLISASVLPVMMPTFSKYQHDLESLRNVLLNFQKYTAIILLPLGVGIFMFSDLITKLLLGEQWMEAAGFIGIWGLMEVVTIIFSRFCSNVYPAIGKPNISVIVQILHLIFLLPAIYWSVQYGFTSLYWTRSLMRLQGVVVNVIFVYIFIKLSFIKLLNNILPEIIGCLAMFCLGKYLLTLNDDIIMQFFYIILCVVTYFSIIICIPQERRIIIPILKIIDEKIKKWIK